MPAMSWREQVGSIIFETDTPAGRAFDIVLLVAIVTSVVVVLLESVPDIRADYGRPLLLTEWMFTGLFTVEYVLRVLTARDRRRYVTSFYGVIDLLAVLPGYLLLLVGATPYLVVFRAMRLLRMFRVLKLTRYVGEASMLGEALSASRYKIIVFLTFVVTSVLVVGSLMYLIEGPARGFDSIPTSMYWAVVTLTTVGYGDIIPHTPLGRFLASCLMILGYGVIAVPTGIVTTEMARVGMRHDAAAREAGQALACAQCGLVGHDIEAAYCRRCGAVLTPDDAT